MINRSAATLSALIPLPACRAARSKTMSSSGYYHKALSISQSPLPIFTEPRHRLVNQPLIGIAICKTCHCEQSPLPQPTGSDPSSLPVMRRLIGNISPFIQSCALPLSQPPNPQSFLSGLLPPLIHPSFQLPTRSTQSQIGPVDREWILVRNKFCHFLKVCKPS